MSDKGMLADVMPVKAYPYRDSNGNRQFVACKLCADILNDAYDSNDGDHEDAAVLVQGGDE